MTGSSNTPFKIPFIALDRQYKTIRTEILNAYDEVMSSGRVIRGDKTIQLEEEIASRCNRKYAVALNSGTSALITSFVSLGFSNKQVICPAESFVATINAIYSTANKPLIIDSNFNGIIDYKKITKKCLEESAALLYVNLYGNCIDYDAMLALFELYGISNYPMIEDAAQSFGSTYKGKPAGSFGTMSCLSFDPTKNLNNYGSGGMLLTDNAGYAFCARQLRSNGTEYSSNMLEYGINTQMSEMDAAGLLVKLKYFDSWQIRRTQIANYYNEELKNISEIDIPTLNSDVKSNWHKYVIRISDYKRKLLEEYLEDFSIETKRHYDKTLYQHSSATTYDKLKDTVAYRNCKEKLSLPIYPEMTDEEVQYIVKTITEYFSQ